MTLEHPEKLKAISFAWTTPSVVAERKRHTRRFWKPHYAKRWHKGDLAWALSRQYQYGGERVAIIEIQEEPYEENLKVWDKREEEFYELEGFGFLDDKKIAPANALSPLMQMTHWWLDTCESPFVVEFKPRKIDEEMREKYTQPEVIKNCRENLFKSLTDMTIEEYVKAVA